MYCVWNTTKTTLWAYSVLGDHFGYQIFHLTSEPVRDSTRPEKLEFGVLMWEPALERREA